MRIIRSAVLLGAALVTFVGAVPFLVVGEAHWHWKYRRRRRLEAERT